MPEIETDNNLISCSRCRVKYHNTSESITTNFGYKRLGDRYKLCIKCRRSKSIKPKVPSPEIKRVEELQLPDCCVCMDELKQDTICKIKCGHGLCKSCVFNMFPNFKNTNILKCPICRREYCTPWSVFEDFEPLIFKIVYKNNVISGGCRPWNLFKFTSKRDLMIDSQGLLQIDETWMKKIKILISILYHRFKSGTQFDPIVIYIYKKGSDSFTLKTNKPVNNEDLICYYDFYECQQDEEIIERFLKTELNKSSFPVNV